MEAIFCMRFRYARKKFFPVIYKRGGMVMMLTVTQSKEATKCNTVSQMMDYMKFKKYDTLNSNEYRKTFQELTEEEMDDLQSLMENED